MFSFQAEVSVQQIQVFVFMVGVMGLFCVQLFLVRQKAWTHYSSLWNRYLEKRATACQSIARATRIISFSLKILPPPVFYVETFTNAVCIVIKLSIPSSLLSCRLLPVPKKVGSYERKKICLSPTNGSKAIRKEKLDGFTDSLLTRPCLARACIHPYEEGVFFLVADSEVFGAKTNRQLSAFILVQQYVFYAGLFSYTIIHHDAPYARCKCLSSTKLAVRVDKCK